MATTELFLNNSSYYLELSTYSDISFPLPLGTMKTQSWGEVIKEDRHNRIKSRQEKDR